MDYSPCFPQYYHSTRLTCVCPQVAIESLNFEEQILHAAKNIAAATSALVKSATAAQRELVAQGKLNATRGSEDSQWSDGLVSAVSTLTPPSHPHTHTHTHTQTAFYMFCFSLSFSRPGWLPRGPASCVSQPTRWCKATWKRPT